MKYLITFCEWKQKNTHSQASYIAKFRLPQFRKSLRDKCLTNKFFRRIWEKDCNFSSLFLSKGLWSILDIFSYSKVEQLFTFFFLLFMELALKACFWLHRNSILMSVKLIKPQNLQEPILNCIRADRRRMLLQIRKWRTCSSLPTSIFWTVYYVSKDLLFLKS